MYHKTCCGNHQQVVQSGRPTPLRAELLHELEEELALVVVSKPQLSGKAFWGKGVRAKGMEVANLHGGRMAQGQIRLRRA